MRNTPSFLDKGNPRRAAPHVFCQWFGRMVSILVLYVASTLSISALTPVDKAIIDGSGEDVIIRTVTTATDFYFVGVSSSSDLPVTDASTYAGDSSSTVVGDMVVGRVSLTTGATVWLTYLGGSASDFGNGIDIDPSGTLTISGWTTSSDFPVTEDAQQSSSGGLSDAVIVQFDAATGTLTYASYLGGSGDDQFADVAYLPLFERWAFGGFTTSQDFPFPESNGASVTTSKSNSDTEGLFVGMSNDGHRTIELAGLHRRLSGFQTIIRAVAAGPGTDGFYIAGTTTETSFWDTGFGAEGEGLEMFVNRINYTTGARRYNKTLGGTGDDTPLDIGFFNASTVIIVGTTTSTDYPTTADLLQPTFGGGTTDGFLHQLDPTRATSDGIATYYGGDGDDAIRAMAKDGSVFGAFHLAGVTSSTDMPTPDTTSFRYLAPGQEANAGGVSDGFVALMDTGLRFSDYSRFTYAGGPGEDGLTTVANDLSYTPTSSADPYLPFAAGTTNNPGSGPIALPAALPNADNGSAAPAAAVGEAQTVEEAFLAMGFTQGDDPGGADLQVSEPLLPIGYEQSIPYGVTFDVVFTLRNNGPNNAASVRFNNDIPKNFNILTTSLTGDGNGTVTLSDDASSHFIDVEIPDFPADGRADLRVTVVLIYPDAVVPLPISIHSSVSSLSNDPSSENNTASVARVGRVVDGDVGVLYNVSDSTPAFGDTVEFEIVVTNHGPEDATGIDIIFYLREAFSSASINPLPQGVVLNSSGNGGFVFRIDLIPFLESRVISGSFVVDFEGPLITSAHIHRASINDTNPENDRVGLELPIDLLGVGRISGLLFNDLDGNSQKDEAEDPRGFVTMQFLDAVTKELLGSTVSLTDGTFVSPYLPSGLSIEVVPVSPPDFARTFTLPIIAEIPSGVVLDLAPMGFVALASTDAAVAGFVFFDFDLNGVRDPGEPPPAPAGFTAFIDLDRNGTLDDGEQSTPIDENGFYRFGELVPSDYDIRILFPAPFTQTGPGATETDPNPPNQVESAAGEQSSGIDFGVFVPIDVSLIFSVDRDDIPRGGTANITIELTNHSAIAVQDVIASLGPETGDLRYVFRHPSSSDDYLFAAENSRFATINIAELTAGETVTLTAEIEAREQGTVVISGAIGSSHGDVDLDNNRDTEAFTVSPPNGEVSGVVYEDKNGNGMRDAGEPGISGLTVVVQDSEGTEHTGLTDQDGSYSVGTLPNGETTVTVTPGSNASASSGTTGTVTVNSDEKVNVGEFGLAVTASGTGGITGIVFDDLNKNGVRDAGEPGLDAIAVYLAAAPDIDPRIVTLPSNVTRDGGRFVFSNLPPGFHYLRILPGSGRIQTTPRPPTSTTPPDLPPDNKVLVQTDLFATADSFGLASFDAGAYSFAADWFHFAPPAPDYTLKPTPTRDDVPFTYDGNRARLIVTGTNNSATAISYSARLVDANGGDLPAGLAGTFDSFTIAAGSTGSVVFDWDTSGHAWMGDSPTQDFMFQVEITIEGSEFSAPVDAPLHIRPRPIVAVHGLWSDVTTWKDYPGFLATIRDDWEFYGVGDDQYDGVMDTGKIGLPGDTRIQTNSLILRNYSEQMRNDRGAVHFDLLGHSMGGLISRHFIQTYMLESPDDDPLAIRLVMLGTPHEGSSLADIMFYVLEKGTRGFGTHYPFNLLELKPSYLNNVFNPRIRDTRGVEFSVAAGAPSVLPILSSAVLKLESPNDGIVPVSSARAFSTFSLTFKYERVVDSNHIDQTHNALVFQQYTFPVLAGIAPAPQSEFASLPVSEIESADVPIEEATQTITFAETIPVGANATVDVPVTVTAARAVGFIVVDIPSIGSSVVDASDNAVAASSVIPGEWGAFIRSHVIESPAAGTYRVRLENLSNETVFVGMSAIELGNPAALVAAASVDGNGDLQVEASISGLDGAPDEVTAQIIGYDATSTTLTLTGPGPYTGSLSDWGPGLFEIVVEAHYADGFGLIGRTSVTSLGDASLTQSPLANGNLLFSWPESLGADVVLESSLGLEPPMWTPIAMLPELMGDRYKIEITPVDPAETFRLRMGAATPLEPLIDTSLLRHTADIDQDSTIDLVELLRVIELYNTRQGTVRTGRYRLNESAVDGFDSDLDTVLDSPPNLSRFHSADSNRDAKLSLTELLRLIEIYNTRSGTVRTGRYRPQSGTVDGFTPDSNDP